MRQRATSWRPFVIFAVVTILGASGASAQSCTYSMTNMNFGVVDLTRDTPFDTTATFTASCTGLSLTTAQVCISFGNGSGGAAPGGDPRYMTSGVNPLSYNLFQDAARTQVFSNASLSVPLGLGGSGSRSLTVYGRIYPNQGASPPGTYTSSFAGAETAVYSGLLNILNCLQPVGTPARSPFSVIAINQPSCTVSVSNLNFGAVTTLASAIDGTTMLTATCSASQPYSISLGGGNSGATDPTQRKMSSGPNEVTYGLYQNSARTLPWGSNPGSDVVSGVGTGSAQSLTVYGRVQSQATPAPGVYTDTVIVNLTY